MEKQDTETVIQNEETVEAYNPETGKTHKIPASAFVGGSGQTIDQYLADTRAGKKELKFDGKLGLDRSKTAPPTDLELEIRAETGNLNRAERRAFFAKQSRAVGKLRKDMLTLRVIKHENGTKEYVTEQMQRARKSA